MTPTPEQIAAMDARGWMWHPPGDTYPFGMFVVAGMVGADQIFELAICPGDAPGEWTGEFTTARLGRIATPGDLLTVAERVEGYLRAVLSPLRFPWLTIAATPKREPTRAPRTCWDCRYLGSGRECRFPAGSPASMEVCEWIGSVNTGDDCMPIPTATPCPGFEAKP